MCAQGPTPYSFTPLKVTTGGRRYAALGTECDNASSSCGSTTFSSTNTSWSSQDSTSLLVDTVCTCGGHCRPMPSVLEAVCCSVEKLKHLEFADDSFQAVTGNCVLNCDDIKNILSTASVRLAWRKQRKSSGFLDAEECKFSVMTNKNYRHHAYREYVEYIHGLLGKHNRKVIPSCVVWYIRGRWPDPHGNYTGYKPGSDEVEDIL